MTAKLQFLVIFALGLFMGIFSESHVLRPLSHVGSTSADPTTHIVGYGQKPSGDSEDSQQLPTLAVAPPSKENETPKPTLAGAPQISVDEPIFNFGDRDAGEVVEHTFTLTNKGDKTLEINEVKTTCSCTVAQISTERIPAGGTAEVTLKLDLHLLKGRQYRTAIVMSNDPITPNLQLSLVGNSVYHVDLNPPQVRFGRFENYEPRTETLTLKADNTVEPFKVLERLTSGENVKVDVEEVEAGKKFLLKIQVTPQENVAALDGWVQLLTDSPGEYGAIGIAVSATFPSAGDRREEGSRLQTPRVSKHSLEAEIGENLEIVGTTIDGDPFDLAAYEGKPTVVIFWASTCGACRNEFISLKTLYEDYHGQGLEIVGVNVDNNVEKRTEFLNEAELPWLNVIAAGEETGISLARRYRVRMIPSISLLDRSGRIIAIDQRGDALREAVSKVFDNPDGS